MLATVLDEIRRIRDGVIAAHAGGRLSRWDDTDTNEEYLQEVFARHKELGEGYPLLVRGIVYTEDFRITAAHNFLKWVSRNPTPPPEHNPYYWRQAEYTYFDEVARGIGKGKARKKATIAYDILMKEDTDKRARMDKATAKYKRDSDKAKSLVAARLLRIARDLPS